MIDNEKITRILLENSVWIQIVEGEVDELFYIYIIYYPQLKHQLGQPTDIVLKIKRHNDKLSRLKLKFSAKS